MSDAPESQALPKDVQNDPQRSLARYAARINITTAMGLLADALIFLAATAGGVGLGPAHILSFTVATALNYHLNIRVALTGAGRARDLRLHGQLIAVSLLALFLRGGVLSLLVNAWAWPAPVAILFAIGATFVVTQPGYAFFLSSSSKWRVGSGTRWQAMAIGLVVYAFVLRLVYLGQVELLPEETYYWNYSRHLDIGYLDHPPMVACLIRLGTAAFGTSQFGVRVGAIFCGVATSFFMYRLTRNLFDKSSALVALVLAQVLPFFFMAGMLMTPDTPLTAAWAAELYFLERALVAGRSGAWLGAGLFLGVGLVSKYSIGLLVPSALLFILLDPQSRRWLRRWEPYAAALIALAIFSPVIVWNAQNEWASFAFQAARRLTGRPQFALHKLVLAALVLMTPTGLLAAAIVLLRRQQEADHDHATADRRRRWRFLQVAVGAPLAVFVAVSLRHNVKFDWTGELWLAALPAVAFGITSSGEKFMRPVGARIRAAWAPTILGVLLIFGAGLHYLVLGLPGLGYGERTELAPIGWRDLAQQVNRIAKQVRDDTGSEPLIVGMDRYQIASEVAFYAADNTGMAPETSSAHLFGWFGLMYERWVPIDLQTGRTLLLIAWNPRDLTDTAVESRAAWMGPLQDGVLTRDRRVIRRYYYRVAYNYRASQKYE